MYKNKYYYLGRKGGGQYIENWDTYQGEKINGMGERGGGYFFFVTIMVSFFQQHEKGYFYKCCKLNYNNVELYLYIEEQIYIYFF